MLRLFCFAEMRSLNISMLDLVEVCCCVHSSMCLQYHVSSTDRFTVHVSKLQLWMRNCKRAQMFNNAKRSPWTRVTWGNGISKTMGASLLPARSKNQEETNQFSRIEEKWCPPPQKKPIQFVLSGVIIKIIIIKNNNKLFYRAPLKQLLKVLYMYYKNL